MSVACDSENDLTNSLYVSCGLSMGPLLMSFADVPRVQIRNRGLLFRLFIY